MLCVEGSSDAISKSLLDKSQVVNHDFTRGPWWPEQTFDIVWAVEFVVLPLVILYLILHPSGARQQELHHQLCTYPGERGPTVHHPLHAWGVSSRRGAARLVVEIPISRPWLCVL